SAILSFIFHSYSHHQHLHSFPTRRSSDLANQRTSPSVTDITRHAALNRHARLGNCLRPWLRLESKLPCRTRILAEDADIFQVAIDRKSTRLNSSHLVISYAVFCLKKKKMQ